MKKLIPVLAVSFAFVAVGIAGFFVCDATKTQPLIRAINRANTAREVRIQEISRVLADSIAATEAWLSQSRVKDSIDVVKSIEHIKATYSDSKHTTAFADGISSLEKMLADVQTEQLPYMVQTRRHINWMKQEMEWLRRE